MSYRALEPNAIGSVVPPFAGGSGGGGGGPGDTGDHFTTQIIVGNTPNGDPAIAQAAPFRYIPDPGDGSGIVAALAAMAGQTGEVYLRAGTYTLAAGGLTVPAGVRVRGAGAAATLIVGPSLGDQNVFLLTGADAELSDLNISSPQPTAATAGAALGVVEISSAAARCAVRRCAFTLATNAAFDRTQRACVYDLSGAVRVESCVFVGQSGLEQPTPSVTFAVETYQTVDDTEPFTMYDCLVDGFNKALFSRATHALVSRIRARNMHQDAAFDFYGRITGVASGIAARLCVSDLDITFSTADAPTGGLNPAPRVGVRLNYLITGFSVSGVTVEFAAQQQNVQPSYGVHVNGINALIADGSITGCTVRGSFSVGVLLRAGVVGDASGIIRDVRVANCVARGAVDLGALFSEGSGGIMSSTGGITPGTVTRCSFANCSFGAAEIASVALYGAGVVDAHVVDNHLTTSFGVALDVVTDPPTTPEVLGNIT